MIRISRHDIIPSVFLVAFTWLAASAADITVFSFGVTKCAAVRGGKKKARREGKSDRALEALAVYGDTDAPSFWSNQSLPIACCQFG